MITEINIEKDYIEYCLQVVVGLSLDELEKHSRDLALALASPTGKIKMIIPIPGKSLVAIQVPKPTEETLKKMLENEKVEKTTLRKIISNIFTLIGALFFTLGEKIENK